MEQIAKEELDLEERLLEMGKTELPKMPNWHMNIDYEGLNEHFEENKILDHHSSISSSGGAGGSIDFTKRSKKSVEEVAKHPNVLEDSFVQIEVMNAT